MYKKCFNKLEYLPSREPFRNGNSTERRDYWGRGSANIRKVDGSEPWVHVERILKKFKGKQVNKAFSKYCSIVPKNQQYWFWKKLDEFDELKVRRRWFNYDASHWYIDKDNRVQYHQAKKKDISYSITSADYEEGYMNHMGETITDDEYNRLNPIRRYGNRWANKVFQEWTPIILNGEVFRFKKKDADFYRCLADENGKANRMQREYDKYAEKKAYSFLTREEEQKIEDKKDDSIRRDAHGFDEDSFTNNNGRLK